MNENEHATGIAPLGPNVTDHTAAIVCAYVANNHVQVAELPALISGVHTALAAIAAGAAPGLASAEPAVEKPTPAQVRKSITHDALISFIDGRSYKTLKRHLTASGYTPEGYRQAFGLPADYPMTAASYSEQRSSLAKALGLGVPGSRAAPAEAPSKPRKAA